MFSCVCFSSDTDCELVRGCPEPEGSVSIEDFDKVTLHDAPLSDDGKASEFRVVIEKGSSGIRMLGLDLVALDDVGAMVHRVKKGGGGLAQEWNGAHPDRDIQKGDCIVEVNGTDRDSERLIRRLLTETSLSLLVRRSFRFHVQIEQTENLGQLALYVSHRPGNKTLEILDSSKGSFEKWNLANRGREVLKGDRIIKVNGHALKADLMHEAIRTEHPLRMVIFRLQ